MYFVWIILIRTLIFCLYISRLHMHKPVCFSVSKFHSLCNLDPPNPIQYEHRCSCQKEYNKSSCRRLNTQLATKVRITIWLTIRIWILAFYVIFIQGWVSGGSHNKPEMVKFNLLIGQATAPLLTILLITVCFPLKGWPTDFMCYPIICLTNFTMSTA